MEEIFSPINGYESKYLISNFGRVYSVNNKCFMKIQIDKYGYCKINLSNGSRKSKKWFFIHQLVAQAFIPNYDRLETVDHIDSNKLNNRVDNLQWMNREDNASKGQDDIKRPVINLTTGETFESIRAAAKAYNTDRHNISNVVRGKQKTACKCQWQYIEQGGDNNVSHE